MPVELIPIAHQIWDAKYRLKRPDGTPIDQTVEDTWRRVAKALASAEQSPQEWEPRFYDAMSDFKFIPAGRILAGAGTERSVTLINCFVQGTIPDSLDGIFSHLREAALTMQQGGGIGYDFSTLRPKGALVKGVDADASGPLSFMDVWDSMCKTLMSAGARRGAMMACMRCDHPDILDFINAKHQVGRLTQFNMSVLVTDTFMDAVKNDDDWALTFPLNAQSFDEVLVHRMVKARELWDAIMRSTYDHAEPGVIFIDRVNRLHNLNYCQTITCTNPCGEKPMPPYSSCDLGSINLAALVQQPFTLNAYVSENKLERIVPLAVRMLDNVYDVTKFPLDQQRSEALAARRLGLGITGLANALAMCGLRYGTPEAAAVARSWMEFITIRAYAASVELAKEKGAFPLFDRNEFVGGQQYPGGSFVTGLPAKLKGAIWEHGIRNCELTSIAPTGTISLFAENVSGGIEPVFAFRFKRKVLQKDGNKTEEQVEDYAYKRWYDEGGAGKILPPWFVTVQDLTPDEHLTMLAAVQSQTDSSVSKTINLPREISFDDFKDVYRKAYDLGCKSCTTYRPNDVTGSVLSVDEPPLHEHDLHCNSDRTQPKFTEGTGCSCWREGESIIDRAVHNSPPPLDDVGGVPEETFDEKDPNKPSYPEITVTMPLEELSRPKLDNVVTISMDEYIKLRTTASERSVKRCPRTDAICEDDWCYLNDCCRIGRESLDAGGVPEETFDEKDPDKPESPVVKDIKAMQEIMRARGVDPNVLVGSQAYIDTFGDEVKREFPDLRLEVTGELPPGDDDDEPDDLLLIRPESLPGNTYKIRWPDGVADHAYYITINDGEDGAPFEVFVNTLDVDHQAWTTALTRMISAIFRRGGNVDFVVEELKKIHDPKGGAWLDKKYVPSLPAAIGGVIERHLGQTKLPKHLEAHLAELNLSGIKLAERLNEAEDREADVQMQGVHCPKCGERSLYYSEGCAKCSSCDWSRCG